MSQTDDEAKERCEQKAIRDQLDSVVSRRERSRLSHLSQVIQHLTSSFAEHDASARSGAAAQLRRHDD